MINYNRLGYEIKREFANFSVKGSLRQSPKYVTGAPVRSYRTI